GPTTRRGVIPLRRAPGTQAHPDHGPAFSPGLPPAAAHLRPPGGPRHLCEGRRPGAADSRPNAAAPRAGKGAAVTGEQKPANLWTDPGVVLYMLLCAVALFVMWLSLAEHALGLVGFLPLGVGLIGVALRFRWTPPLVLVTLAGAMFFQQLVLGSWAWQWRMF